MPASYRWGSITTFKESLAPAVNLKPCPVSARGRRWEIMPPIWDTAGGDEVEGDGQVAGSGGIGGGEGGAVSEEDIVDRHRYLDARFGGGIEEDGAVPVHGVERLEQRGSGTGGDYDDVGEAAVIYVAEPVGGVLVGPEGFVSAEAAGGGEAENPKDRWI